MAKLTQNAKILTHELRWLESFIKTCLKTHTKEALPIEKPEKLLCLPPRLYNHTPYTQYIRKLNLSNQARVVLLLALAPQVVPYFFNSFARQEQDMTTLGLIRHNTSLQWLPSVETALFLLAGRDLEARFTLMELFDQDHSLTKENILRIQHINESNSPINRVLHLSEEYTLLLTTGQTYRPGYSAEFPAQRLNTALEWDDLIVAPKTRQEIKEIEAWIRHEATLVHDWGLGKRIKAGYRVLFYGPSGTGKTLTAALLGKTMQMDVYRIDLSMVVSKYIGETEKNLAKVFDRAENKGWILFFDEADALFGERTQTKSSNDRYANQEVSYLLQRIEDFAGTVILASNQKDLIDKAFARRFQAMIAFEPPSSTERLQLWERAFSKKSQLDKNINLQQLADTYEVTGGMIINVVRHASLMALERNTHVLLHDDLLEGIKREFKKAGKLWVN